MSTGRRGTPRLDISEHARRAEQLALFLSTQERYPSVYGPADEKALYVWWARERLLAERGELPGERARLYDGLCPSWRDRPGVVAFRVHAEQLQRFREQHDRFPRQGAGSAEASLYNWLTLQRERSRGDRLKASLQAILDEISPGWLADPVYPTSQECAEDLVAFVQRARRLPSSASDDREERRIASWLSRARRKAVRGALPADIVKTLEIGAPGWRSTSSDREWDANLGALALYIAANRRLPTAADVDAIALHQWLKRQREAHREGTLTADRQRALDHVSPGWSDSATSDTARAERVQALAAFRAAHGRWPARKAADVTERQLERWWREARSRAKAQTLRDETRLQLDATCPGWSDPLTAGRPRTGTGRPS